MVDVGIYATYALIGVAVLLIILFFFSAIAKNPQLAKNAGIGVGALVVLIIIAYALSTGSDAETLFAKLDITEGTSKQVGTGLITFYILAGAAVLSILYVEVTRLFK